MEESHDKWIESVLGSTQELKRAQPDEAIFARVMEEITAEKTKVVSFKRMRWVAAAGIMLLCLNGITLWRATQTQAQGSTETITNGTSGESLIFDYNFYEL